jgi:hypothetical protein
MFLQVTPLFDSEESPFNEQEKTKGLCDRPRLQSITNEKEY